MDCSSCRFTSASAASSAAFSSISLTNSTVYQSHTVSCDTCLVPVGKGPLHIRSDALWSTFGLTTVNGVGPIDCSGCCSERQHISQKLATEALLAKLLDLLDLCTFLLYNINHNHVISLLLSYFAFVWLARESVISILSILLSWYVYISYIMCMTDVNKRDMIYTVQYCILYISTLICLGIVV